RSCGGAAHWRQRRPWTKVQGGILADANPASNRLKHYERGSTKKPGEKRNDHLAKCRCRARMRAAVARCRGLWAGRRSAERATSRTQRGDEQVLPVPYRCDVSRPAAGSPRMGGRDLSHDRTRRGGGARKDQADGRITRPRFLGQVQTGPPPPAKNSVPLFGARGRFRGATNGGVGARYFVQGIAPSS